MSPKKRRRGHGEGSIHQRPDGRWTASVDLGIVNGKRRRKYVYGKTRKEVAEKLKALHTQQQQGVKLAGGTKTVEQHLAWWLEHVVRAERSSSTYVTYESLIRVHIVPTIGAIKLRDLTAERCQELWNALKTTLAPRSIKSCRAIVVTALELAVRWGDIPRNVATLTEMPTVEKHEPPLVDQDKARRLLKAAAGERLEALLYAALETGCRIGELIALRRRDLDLVKRAIRVEGSMGRSLKTEDAPSRPQRGPTKGRKPRTLTISPQLAARLREHLQRVDAERAEADDWDDHGLVFPSSRGTPLLQQSVGEALARVLERAGLEPMTFHSLRHWSASLMLANGVSPAVVKERLGHAAYATTMDIYAHVIPQVEEGSAETMGKLLEGDEDEREA